MQGLKRKMDSAKPWLGNILFPLAQSHPVQQNSLKEQMVDPNSTLWDRCYISERSRWVCGKR